MSGVNSQRLQKGTDVLRVGQRINRNGQREENTIPVFTIFSSLIWTSPYQEFVVKTKTGGKKNWKRKKTFIFMDIISSNSLRNKKLQIEKGQELASVQRRRGSEHSHKGFRRGRIQIKRKRKERMRRLGLNFGTWSPLLQKTNPRVPLCRGGKLKYAILQC